MIQRKHKNTVKTKKNTQTDKHSKWHQLQPPNINRNTQNKTEKKVAAAATAHNNNNNNKIWTLTAKTATTAIFFNSKVN